MWTARIALMRKIVVSYIAHGISNITSFMLVASSEGWNLYESPGYGFVWWLASPQVTYSYIHICHLFYCLSLETSIKYQVVFVLWTRYPEICYEFLGILRVYKIISIQERWLWIIEILDIKWSRMCLAAYNCASLSDSVFPTELIQKCCNGSTVCPCQLMSRKRKKRRPLNHWDFQDLK